MAPARALHAPRPIFPDGDQHVVSADLTGMTCGGTEQDPRKAVSWPAGPPSLERVDHPASLAGGNAW